MKHKPVLGTITLLVALLTLLGVSVWFSAQGWMSVEGSAIPLAGYIAMAAGIFFTLVVGIGLMSLVFYSRRHGYDDAADRGRSERED
jgi:hypothetical protein